MFLFKAIKIVSWMICRNNKLRKAKKFEKKGMLEERDRLVHESVPVWARYVLEQCPAEVEVIGHEKIPQDQAVVFIANHQSNMDIPVMLGYIDRPIAFVAKAELTKVPILSSWMRLMQCTFMKRNSPRDSVKAIHDAVDGLKRGYSQMIFPEGTRSRGGPHLDFKAGSFKLAFMAEAAIVPVTLDGTYHLMEEKGKLAKGKVKVTIHDPVYTAGLSKEELHAIPAKVEEICCAPLPPPIEVTLKKKK